ncbi:MAG: 3-methyladenine DNA glycosylase [Ignavibacteria bacterium RBG_13_36_8]|nr:MAG: 3-methyladenine DNA glycosylase [Ignavibacteria bacterium RBG_13_36_8]
MAAFKKKLPKNFYIRDVLTVAKELIGKVLVYQNGNKKLSGKIVEVEAYRGSVDQASHSFNGKTKRNEVMFEEGGLLYIYFTYGVHFCCNVVTGKCGQGDAVLLRAVEPVSGIEEMAINRFNKKKIDEKELINLANGPGKICRAFNFNRSHNGTDLTGNQIYILDKEKIKNHSIVASTRIGIKKSVDLPWRFYIKDNPFVSKK